MPRLPASAHALRKWLAPQVARLRERDLTLIAGLSVLFALAWTFIELADEIGEPETMDLDRALLLALRADSAGTDPLGPDWLEGAALNISALGSGAVVALLVVAISGFVLLARKPKLALLLVASSAGSGVLVFTLKAFFQRGRPDVVIPILPADGLSFPSGHALVSAALYPTLGVLLALTVRPLRLRLYVIAASAALALLIGATRVYLGVHYATDVLAGWTLGLAWALLLGLISRALQRRGVIEQPAKTNANSGTAPRR